MPGTWKRATFVLTTDDPDIGTVTALWENNTDPEDIVTYSQERVNKTVQTERDAFVTAALAKVAAHEADMTSTEQAIVNALNA